MSDWTNCVTSPDVDTEGFRSLAYPVHRASTIVFPDAQAYAGRHERGLDGYTYGLSGTPTVRALEQKISALEGGGKTLLVPSGQAASALAILSFIKGGDRLLIADSAYPPIRDFAQHDLQRMGVEVAFYDPTAPEKLEILIDERTRMIWVESPGSTTMEVQDVPRICAIAHKAGVLVGCDNTWATPLHFKPLAHGADIVVEALTKYFAGHSDALMGSITLADPENAKTVRATLNRFGIGVSPDECSLVLRGIETMAVRLDYASRTAAKLAELFSAHPLVDSVLYPPLKNSPGHEIWQRDFSGASAVFSVVFKTPAIAHVSAALDALKTISIGASWGGTRSLVAPMPVKQHRTARPWTGDDLVLRISVGLEDAADLEADAQRLLNVLATHATEDAIAS